MRPLKNFVKKCMTRLWYNHSLSFSQTMQPTWRTVLTLFMLLVLGSGTSLFAQTEPDTVRRKPSLPTGPTPTQQQQPRPQPRVIETPPVQQQPQVIVKQGDKEEKEKLPLIDRLYWGGGLGLQFGTYTAVSVAPIIGYKATDKLWMGGGAVYQYQGGNGVSLQTVGGKTFVQYDVVKGFLVHAGYELLSVEYEPHINGATFEKKRKMVGLPLAGLGYRQYISDRVSSDLLVLYNFNDELANPYSNPVIRVSLNFPFRR